MSFRTPLYIPTWFVFPHPDQVGEHPGTAIVFINGKKKRRRYAWCQWRGHWWYNTSKHKVHRAKACPKCYPEAKRAYLEEVEARSDARWNGAAREADERRMQYILSSTYFDLRSQPPAGCNDPLDAANECDHGWLPTDRVIKCWCWGLPRGVPRQLWLTLPGKATPGTQRGTLSETDCAGEGYPTASGGSTRA